MTALSITFDDMSIEIDGLFCGSFCGSAELDEDGLLESITLEGWNGFKRDAVSKTHTFAVPYAGSVPTTFIEHFQHKVAAEIRRQYGEAMQEAVAEYWNDYSESGREHDANEHID